MFGHGWCSVIGQATLVEINVHNLSRSTPASTHQCTWMLFLYEIRQRKDDHPIPIPNETGFEILLINKKNWRFEKPC
jgi:hypothetical protein